MSESTFHKHFKKVTSMTPLQYQKSLRLHEARRLMLSDSIDASSASGMVGYVSDSH
jgi:AraC-like DNA-binding protein